MMLKLLLLLIPTMSFAQVIKLVEDLPLNMSVTETRGRVVEFEQEDLNLVGHARQLDLSKVDKLVQIVWTEIRDARNDELRVVLDEPLSCSFNYKKSLLKAKTNIPLDYNPEIIKVAMDKLKEGKIDSTKIVMKGEAKNVKSTRRSLLDLGNNPQEYTQTITNDGNNFNVNSKDKKNTHEQQRGNISNHANLRAADFGNNSSDNSFFAAQLNNQGQGPNTPNNLPSGSVNNQLDVAAANLNPDKTEAEVPEPEAIPEIVVKVTTDGCSPRVDEDLSRVIIQDRTIKYIDGVETPPQNPEDGACSDSNVQFAIHKRYDCPNCRYILNCKEENNQKYACATFQKYWTDATHQEHLITKGDVSGGALYTDLSKPFAITKEVGKCEYEINLDTMQALPQTEEVYRNRNNRRILVAHCTPDANLNPIPIKLSANCPLVHDYANNVSRIQKKATFTINNVEHMARGCVETDETIPHEFVVDGCNANIDPIMARYARMGKRKITLLDGKTKILSQECEVIGQADNLLSTREGCVGEYVHDFVAGISYEKHHFYYLEGNRPVYLPACMRSTVSYQHEKIHDGYEFDEEGERAIKKMATFINPPEGRLNIAPAMTDVTYGIFPYQKLGGEETRLTSNFAYDDCFKITQTELAQKLRRPDGTIIDKILGPGLPHRSHNLCVITEESGKRTVQVPIRSRFLRSRGGKRYNEVAIPQKRLKTVYPDGRAPTYTPWVDSR